MNMSCREPSQPTREKHPAATNNRLDGRLLTSKTSNIIAMPGRGAASGRSTAHHSSEIGSDLVRAACNVGLEGLASCCRSIKNGRLRRHLRARGIRAQRAASSGTEATTRIEPPSAVHRGTGHSPVTKRVSASSINYNERAAASSFAVPLSEKLRIRQYVFGPKFAHDALNFVGVVVMPIGRAVPELTQAHGAGFSIRGIGRESCISWLVGNARWCDHELIPSNQSSRFCHFDL